MTETTLTINQAGPDDGAPTADAPAPKAAAQPGTTTDAGGRVLTFKKPSVLEEYRLVRIVGDVSDRYMGMLAPLVWVRSIDGDPVAFPNSQRDIDLLIQRLGEDGVTATMEFMMGAVNAGQSDANE
ncbi:hypothetical protein, partial [Luteibacter sp.]|uniref:hypothetical protein n=1 Tax=Luteibacter sp. TaxID=1886636 RepID=UPI0025BB85E0